MVKLEDKTVYDKAIVNWINRLQGQINGALKMIEEGKDCKDVVTQLSAAKSALNRTMNVIVSENLVECVKETMNNPDEDTDELVKEAVELLNKSRWSHLFLFSGNKYPTRYLTNWNSVGIIPL